MARPAVIAFAIACAAGGARAQDLPDENCAGLAKLPSSLPRPEAFHVPPATLAHLAKVKLASKEAREFRTVLRVSARYGPNFAGSYTLAIWGCGSSCASLAVVDQRTGDVFFTPGLSFVAAHADEPFDTLTFHPDSRLLIVSGAPNEDESRQGVSAYLWTGRTFKLLKRLTYAQVCPATSSHPN